MTGGDQIFDDGRADEAGGSGDENAHEQDLQISLRDTFRAMLHPGKVVTIILV